MNHNKTSGLQTYAEKRKKETATCVNQVIDRMKGQQETINFSTVAKRSGVSRGTLYNNDLVRERIMSLRSLQAGNPERKEKKERQLLEEKIAHLRGRIKTLEQEKELLIVQLVMQEDIRRENERLKKNEKIRS
ncbi:MAG: DUF6262 family protein [Lachnospiraceae bacterium]|nr:DUF6262 family protein [Lachnospiraceae bacterium]